MGQNFYNLTNPQKNIWSIEQFYPNTNINNICGTVTINQEIDLDLLNKAINLFVKTNKSFGLNFKKKDGNLVQYFTEHENIEFKKVYLKDYSEAHELAIETSNHVFDICDKRLYDFILYKLENGYGGFIVLTHHIISDAATLGLIGEVVENYANLLENNITNIDKNYSYENYIQDEKDYLDSNKFLKDKEYWNSLFSTVPELAEIPSNKPSSNEANGKSERINYIIEKDLLEKIAEFCKQNKISNFNFFMAIYAIYLSRVSNLNDFVIGTPILNRTNFNEKHAAGMFINTAALRINIDDNISFVEFVKQIAQSSFSMLRYQRYPYEELLRDLRKKQKDLPALFDLMLSYQVTKANDKNVKLHYDIEWIPTSTISNGIYIHLHDNNDDGILNISYDYQIQKYEKSDIDNMHMRILNIIKQILVAPNCIQKDIEIVTPKEKDQILNEFNNTAVDYPCDKTIVNLFEEQVKLTPDNIAVVFENQKLTYRELNEKANQLANYLISNNIKIGDVVGIYLQKSLEVIISMLAILKTGAAFLPLDIDYPEERLNYIINKANPKVILSSEETAAKINTPTISVDLTSSIYKSGNIDNLKLPISAKDIMYVMFTSGSTGNPKGVMVKHKNIVRLAAFPNFIKFSKDEVMVQTGTIVFDACIFEIFGSLLHGFKLHILKKENILDIPYFSNFLDKENVTILFLTTGLFNQFCMQNPNMFKKLKYLLTGGDVISKTSVSEVLKCNSKLKIINCYGPTENGSYSTCYKINGKEDIIPIGKPITNSTAYIVSKNGHLLPIGVPGELWVGGYGVGKGYINQEDLTKEKFIPNPFGKGEIYKTGDLVKWLPDGNIEFIGRIDNQVKIRGFRIELSEINKKILTIDKIKHAVTLVRNINDTKTICSYIVSDKKINVSDLKSTLAKYLPNYMIPTFIIQLKDLPLNINGKVDTKALPTPTADDIKKDIVPIRNDIDKIIVSTINEVLNINNISIDDSFFDLGGDSLSAINFSNILASKLNVNINVKSVFEKPIISDLSDYISCLNKTDKNTIKPADKMEYYPVSSAQKRIYYASSIDNNSVLYNISGGIITDTLLNIKLLEKCFKELINRHDSLRTHFDIKNNNIIQIIDDEVDFNLSNKNISTDNLENVYKDFIKPFELSKAPLFRAEVVNIKNQKSLLLLDMHHIISDGTSLSTLLQELCDLYNGNKLPEKYIDYKDFTLWEIEQNKKETFNNSKKFWVNQFKDDIPLLNMPTTYTRPSIQNFEGANYYNTLSKDVFEKINKTTKKLGITPYMLMLSVYYILLSKYSSQDTIVVGTPVIGRELPELSNIIGMFVNTLALKSKINYNESFSDYANSIKEYSLSAFKNQTYPFNELVNELNIKREASRNPLFDVMFIYQNGGYPTITLNNTHTEYFIPTNNISKFDLSLEVIPVDNEFLLRFEYCTSLFNEDFIKRFASHYSNILNAVLENPDIKIDNIDIISEEEKNQILYNFNNTYIDYSKDKTIVNLFEEQVKKSPNKIALVFENEKLTYDELNKRSNQLANYLIENGATNNSIIGIMLPRSLEMLISILGVLKSGAAYLPIDPDYPAERISYILEDSNAKMLISFSDINKSLENEVIYLDKLNLTKYSDDNINTKINSEDLSYIIYTSGSTGKPKGVKLKHLSLSNLTNYCNNYVEYLKNNKYKAVVSVTTVSFDIFIFETLISLQKGLKLVIANDKEQNIPICLDKLIEKENIEIIQTTPSRMQIFYNNIENMPHFKNLKYITLAGEQLPISLVKNLKNETNGVIYNGYGPSETTVFSTLTDVTNQEKITIGKPLFNTQIYIMNNNKLCPIGVPGEICISGDGVGYGYINKDELTKASFVKNPFNDSIIYKTGDLGYYDKSGEIICLGRIDNQVKIRGLRIELDEIEKAILDIPNITNCTVIKNNESLCAYLVKNGSINISNIKKTLYKTLPNYMVPQYFVELEELPYTPNGKIDRKKLPAPKIELSGVNTLSRNNIDDSLIQIIKEILNLDNVNIDDSIFDLGGDSLTAINLSTIIYKKFEITLSIKDIFKHPTIKELSDYISTLSKDKKVAIQLSKKMDYYPISFAQSRIYYASKMDTDSILYNISGGIILDNKLDTKLLEKCIKELFIRHDALRTHFDIINNEIVQIIDNKINFKLLIENNKTDDLNTIYKNFVKPFDLTVAPLFRAKLVNLNNNKSLLLIDMHHIISDGTSLNILLQELCDLYNGKTLPEKLIDYKDFAVFEKEHSKNFKDIKDFWINQYDGEIPILNMPTCFPRPSIQSFEGSTYHTKLSKEVIEKIDDISKKLEITPYMLLLSVYYILLSKYTSQKSIVIGTPVVGRDMPELSNIIGMFVNTLALKNDVNNNEKFNDFVNRIKKYCLSAFENQNYPFDELVKELEIKKDVSRNSLFDVMFSYQNEGYPPINFNNTTAEYLMPDNNISKFDLTLNIIPNNYEFDLNFEYCTKLFDEKFIENLSIHYKNILNIVLDNFEIKISDINIISETENYQILYDFNNTYMDYPRDKTIVDLFEEQVNKAPKNIAVAYEDKKLTYFELNRKANDLAHLLISKGIKNGDIVGVYLNRSPELIISIIGILKAGAVYMPMYTGYPDERLTYVIENSNSNFIITTKTLSKKLNTNAKKIIINNVKNFNASNPLLTFEPDNLAYCIYTSGSTGKPKGVKITHRNLINFISSFTKYYGGITSKDNFLASTNISFDVSIWEIFMPLLNGAKLVLNTEEIISDITLYCKNIIKNKITSLYIPPNILDEVYNLLSKNKQVYINKLLVGVEAIKKSTLNNYYNLNKDLIIVNGYGPTETTICATALVYSKDTSDGFVSIGRPLNNNKVYILDNNHNLCPIGVPGELYISGDGVGKGYLNNEKETKKLFINSPFKAYKTGDLAKWNNDGTITFIGRIDNQVKLNGYRIELNEINSCILSYPSITKCYSTVIKNKNTPFLVSYFVADNNVITNDLKTYLQSKLAFYMIPKFLIQLEALPMTINGKIDNKLLPVPSYKSNTTYAAPRNDFERTTSKIMSELLGLKEIGIDDNFFDIGCDSITAIKFQIEALNANLDISYSNIFEYPTIRLLSENKNTMKNTSSFEVDKNYDYININALLNKNSIDNIAKIETLSKNTVLLLGSTGFLGAHILDSYFTTNPNGTIYCIIRKKSLIDPSERLRKTLNYYFDNKYDDYFNNKKIIVIEGDICSKNFGLSIEKLNNLMDNIDTIINSAALVKHYGSYEMFSKINIEGTKTITNICKKYNKKLYHISTISVSGLGSSNVKKNTEKHQKSIFNETSLYVNQELNNVYIYTKFEAEKHILEEIQNGLDATILRIGNLTNRFTDGKFQINVSENAFVSKIKSIINLEVIQRDMFKHSLELSPVDLCANAIIKVVNSKHDFSMLHLINTNFVECKKILKYINDAGFNVNAVSDRKFANHVTKYLNADDLKDSISGIVTDLGKNKTLDYTAKVIIEANITKAFLNRLGFYWPVLDDIYFEKYFKFFKDINYFTKDKEN